MRTVGAYEAKTNLSRLLDDVAGGQTIVITKHGVPVAKLVPADGRERDVGSVIDELKELRRQVKPLDEVTVRELIDDGRRF